MIFLIKSISITKKRMEEKEAETRLRQLERGSSQKKKKKKKKRKKTHGEDSLSI